MIISKTALKYVQKQNKDETGVLEYLENCCDIELLKKDNIEIIINIFSFWPTEIEARKATDNKILVSPGWADILIKHKNQDTLNAFHMTIGHELGHMHNRDFKIKINSDIRWTISNASFTHWVNEVEHDYYGAMVLYNNQRKTLLDSVNYKLNLKKQKNRKSWKNDDISHPSWNRRKHYVEAYKDFDMPLIREIAKDTGCKDEKLIQRIYGNYESIELK